MGADAAMVEESGRSSIKVSFVANAIVASATVFCAAVVCAAVVSVGFLIAAGLAASVIFGSDAAGEIAMR